jgi:hypothetical protein
VLTVTGNQAFSTEEFTVKVRPFTHTFNLGTFYGVTAYVTQFRIGGIWEKLIGYDRESESITNAISTAKSQAIGEITQEFGGVTVNEYEEGGGQFWTNILTGNIFDNEADALAEAESSMSSDPFGIPSFGVDFVQSFFVDPVIITKKIPREVTEITANLFVELIEGQEITVFNQRTAEAIKLTINQVDDDQLTTFGPGENIVIDVQDDSTKSFFPAGSLIFAEEGFKESSIKVDPSRIQLAVIGARGGDGIGVLTADVGEGTTTQISLNRIDDTVTLKDDQALILTNKFGDVKQFTVDGVQVLSTPSDTINVNDIVIAEGEPIFEAGTATVKEPSYSTSSRITVQEDSITSAVNLATDAVNATSAIDQRVTATEASITQSVQFNEVSGEVRLIAGPGGSQFSVAADQVNIDGTTTFSSGFDPSTKETPGGAQAKANAAQSAAQAFAQDLVDNLDLSAEDLDARDEFATFLGFSDYASLVASANFGQTIISGGFLRTSLIDVVNLLAQNITFTGSLIGNNFTLDGSVSNVNEGNILEVGNSFRIDGGGGLEADGFFELGGQSATVQGIVNEGSDGAMIQYGNGSDTLGLDANFNGISVGTGTNGTNLKVNGNIEYTGTISQASDANLKENVVELGPTLDKISQIEAKIYDMVDDDEREIGLFAQDVEPLFPEAVNDTTGVDEDGNPIEYKTLSYIQLIPALIESIKELKKRIEALEQQS